MADPLAVIRERAQSVLDILEVGRTDPLASSGCGYEHMGDMAWDLKPLAEACLALVERLEQAEAALRDIEGSLLAYWTDIPEAEVQRLVARLASIPKEETSG